ncbi:MAG: hypothetical protein RIE16_02405, partial [Rhodospirillales bacterium]
MPMLTDQRPLFDIPSDVAWFNCASRTPLLKASQTAGQAGIATRAQPWTMDSAKLHSQAEHIRALVAGLIGARAGDTARAALPPCHWIAGTVSDLEAVGARCREVGAALVVD